jgi:RNA polymerase sigma factor (sigma-70 family)
MGLPGDAKNAAGAPPAAGPICFTDVVNEHWTPVYRMLYVLTGNTHDTEDLTQETFLRALDRLDSFQPGTRMRAWLLRIASNAFLDVCRKRQRVTVQPLAVDPPADVPPAEQALETAEQAALVRAALAELSETTRMVFHLRAQEDLSFREIAELVGTSEQAARWHMHQARSKLLKQLDENL